MRYFLPIFLMVPLLVFSQGQSSVDFIKIDAEIKPYSNATISGIATYNFKINQPTDTLVFDAIDMEFSDIYYKGKNIAELSNYDGKQLKIGLYLEPGDYNLKLGFTVQPKQTVYFIKGEDESLIQQVWTQGQGKYTSHWLPSFDNMNEKLELDLTVHVPPKFIGIANGKLKSDSTTGNLRSFRYDMSKPMSSYLAAFAIGNFDKKTITSKSGIPIELYYEPKDSLKVEPTYRYSREIFDYLEEEIGVAYPWQNYKQVPVQDFLYAGMENTTCTIFSNQYVIDSTAFIDKNYVNVNAHELAHQWFGNLVTEESGEHHWLHEGFATYYAYLAERELFGDDHFYWKLYQTANTLHNLSENEGGEALTDPNANSLTFYEKGAWALMALRERMGGDPFRKGIQNYLHNYAFKNATISNFLYEMEQVSETDLNAFRERWLESEEFPWNEAREFLMAKNESIKLFFELQDETSDATVFDEKKLKRIWGKEIPIPFRREFVFKYGTQVPDSFLGKIIARESLEVRQAIAQVISEIPENLQSSFESMLEDRSYVTQETVLFKLWRTFPDRQKDYLDQLDGVVGLPNKNLRLLWLTLALITEDYQIANKKAFYNELNNYTQPYHNFEVCQLAFQYLFQIGGFNDKSLENLLRASNHHVWQFKKTSRNLFRELNRSNAGKVRLAEWRPTLSEEQRQLLDVIVNP